jgi:hypothetical protein
MQCLENKFAGTYIIHQLILTQLFVPGNQDEELTGACPYAGKSLFSWHQEFDLIYLKKKKLIVRHHRNIHLKNSNFSNGIQIQEKS